MWKQATTGILTLGASVAGVDMSTLNVDPVRAEFALKERVTIEQRGDTVEAVLPWKDQPGLKVKYDMGTPTALEKLKDKRNKQVVVEQVSTDAMKIDIILHSKPNTNTFCYQIDGWEQYDFFYQPALTAEEIEQGAVRPEEIVGSYAVYHKTLKNHEEGKTNYETGKVAHIPYPYIWSVDATGTTKHRAEAFDITDGRMCVTVAQSDLDTMEYPIRVDPTFGYTSAGASNADRDLNAYGSLFTLTEGATVTKLTMYGESVHVAHTSQGNIYQSDNTQVTNGVTATRTGIISVGWIDYTYSTSPVLTSGDYYLANRATNNTGTSNIAYDASAGTGFSDASCTVGGWDSPLAGETDNTNKYSIYATYTAAAEPAPTPQPMVQVGGAQVMVSGQLFVQ